MRDNTERGQDHNVDLRVPKEPEDVLEHHRVTTTRSVKEAGVEVDIEQHHGNRACEHRHYRDQQIRRDQPRPDEHRHFHQRHARRTHVQNGRDDVDATHDR